MLSSTMPQTTEYMTTTVKAECEVCHQMKEFNLEVDPRHESLLHGLSSEKIREAVHAGGGEVVCSDCKAKRVS